MVPVISPGLPGITTSTRAFSASNQDSVWTRLISSPTNFLANPGMPSAGWTWSMSTVTPPSSSVIVTALRIAPWASHTRSRNAPSISIASTSAIGAS